ncbi:MAG: SDR family NAD(P)-dependent oxidoreductase [Lachnospiraceae bacterium]|nr:SDR family NAD(P)-dependent oxidoreductase [Lachnospiraceae bacterium]MCI9661398.1 SDR family NAD(P)-dependent oxidoreductase [Lachnospiraceae bacterium]
MDGEYAFIKIKRESRGAYSSVPQNVFHLYGSIKSYPLRTWINNAGFGNYGSIGNQNLERISRMLHLNVETLTIFSSLFVRDFKDTKGTQLINVSSCGGYTIVPNAVTYCAAKFYVSILYRNESYT